MVNDKLVERMCKAMIKSHQQRNKRRWNHEWDHNLRADMAAALHVAVDALLAELRRTLAAQTTLPHDHMRAICNTVRVRLEGKQ